VACSKGLSKLVGELLIVGANPNLQTLQVDDDDGYNSIGKGDAATFRQTPLHVAIVQKQEGAIRAIIEHKSM
jgi:hypothetical protein